MGWSTSGVLFLVGRTGIVCALQELGALIDWGACIQLNQTMTSLIQMIGPFSIAPGAIGTVTGIFLTFKKD